MVPAAGVHHLMLVLAEVSMYSPRLPDRLTPPLYRQARAEGRPMTELAADAVERYLLEAGALEVDQAGPEVCRSSPV